jgi:hypothetical protein
LWLLVEVREVLTMLVVVAQVVIVLAQDFL